MARLNSHDFAPVLKSDNSIQYDFNDHDKCIIETRPFGAYLLLQSTGYSGSQKSTVHAFLGSLQKGCTDRAITVFNNQYPLVVTGTTRIYGDLLTGSIQLTTGQIDGKGVIYKDYLHGRQIIANDVQSPYKRLSAIDNYIEYVYKILKNKAYAVSTSLQLTGSDTTLFNENVLVVQGNLDLKDIEIRRSEHPLTIIVSGWVEISGTTTIKGEVEIISEKFIRITDNAAIIDGLIMAEDSIVLNGDAYISAQVISKQEITVADNAECTFPALILVSGDSYESRSDYGIRISSHMPLEANIMYVSSDTMQQRDNELIIIDSSTTLSGCIYSSDFMSLQGQISGSIMTSNFKFTIPPTTYINWLKDVTIDRLTWDYTPVLPLVESESSFYDIIPMRFTNE
ncbi:MAG: hypothetical protein R3F48_12510 [Candidatus Zixiibacteriota bacterium]